jgi:hypothetical protein
LNMDSMLGCAGPAHIGQMERVRARKALPDCTHPLRAEKRRFAAISSRSAQWLIAA